MSRAIALAVGLLVCLSLASCAAAPSVDALPSGDGTEAAVADSGPAPEVAAVRSAVHAGLSAELSAADQRQDRRARFPPATRLALLRAAETGRRADAIAAALAHLDGTPNPRTDGRFTVERWQGITVRGARASALVLGHSSYTPTAASSQARDDTGQYQVLLVRRQGRWLVDAVRTVLLQSG